MLPIPGKGCFMTGKTKTQRTTGGMAVKKVALIAVVIGCGLLVYLMWPKTISVDPTGYDDEQKLTLEDVLLHADLAVVGTVDALAPSQWSVGEDGENLDMMYTDATVRPAQAFLTYKPDEKQPSSLPEEITVRLDGGKIGWEKQTYRSEAVLEPGEDVLLLLEERGIAAGPSIIRFAAGGGASSPGRKRTARSAIPTAAMRSRPKGWRRTCSRSRRNTPIPIMVQATITQRARSRR